VHNRDRGKITEELVKAGFKFTVIGSTGGFLPEADLSGLESLIAQNCKAREQLVNVMPFESGAPGAFIPNPVKVPVGGAVVFVLAVEQFSRF
jgi:uncharacterized protein YaaQ